MSKYVVNEGSSILNFFHVVYFIQNLFFSLIAVALIPTIIFHFLGISTSILTETTWTLFGSLIYFIISLFLIYYLSMRFLWFLIVRVILFSFVWGAIFYNMNDGHYGHGAIAFFISLFFNMLFIMFPYISDTTIEKVS
ncbi:hypothetical protein [Alkalicoccobacillus gibsonii]|uniref:hypothetical protein n=1 Tax=Alkalicoccobacillus gibsonii TaxID=79881 RepID=UPI00193191E7|nr:hypothetical protein [Alkalicoccobacillus gibsonii]MBM0064912.1 hypothetical protein [Alkalicoccobacillus gibsonii]